MVTELSSSPTKITSFSTAVRSWSQSASCAQAICVQAKASGYRAIRLDTLPSMSAARGLYAAMGFVPVPAYVFNPIEGTLFLELDLRAWQPG